MFEYTVFGKFEFLYDVGNNFGRVMNKQNKIGLSDLSGIKQPKKCS